MASTVAEDQPLSSLSVVLFLRLEFTIRIVQGDFPDNVHLNNTHADDIYQGFIQNFFVVGGVNCICGLLKQGCLAVYGGMLTQKFVYNP